MADDKPPVCELDSLVRETNEGTYNLKDTSGLTRNPGSSRLVRMSPSRFFDFVYGYEDEENGPEASSPDPTPELLAGTNTNFRSAEGLNEAFTNGDPVPVPFLEYNVDTNEIINHEGRQRLKVLQLTGQKNTDRVPVKISCVGEDFRPTECTFSNKNDLVREFPERQIKKSKQEYQARADDVRARCNSE